MGDVQRRDPVRADGGVGDAVAPRSALGGVYVAEKHQPRCVRPIRVHDPLRARAAEEPAHEQDPSVRRPLRVVVPLRIGRDSTTIAAVRVDGIEIEVTVLPGGICDVRSVGRPGCDPLEVVVAVERQTALAGSVLVDDVEIAPAVSPVAAEHDLLGAA